ncbi:MAG: hypothetical protein GY816_02855 [Cytophagales bacterium]|nr:hypothetical protein [Cytophagales bacterium]
MIKRLIFIHFSLMALVGLGQNHMQIFVDGQEHGKWDFSDTLELKSRVDNQIHGFWADGYLFSGLDSASRIRIYLHKGRRIELQDSDGNSISLSKLIQSGQDQIQIKMEAGYPFAKLVWDSLQLENGKLKYIMNLEEGPFIKNDSIVMISTISTEHRFIARSLGIEKGTSFREKDFDIIPDRMERMPFLKLKSKPDISFQDGNAWTYLDLEENRTGRFEGVLGVLPNQSPEKKALITGSLDLSLLNLFRSGKELDFSWQRFGIESQMVDLRYKHPYVVGSKLHIEGKFGLTKQDTSFVTQDVGLIASIFITDKLEFGFAFEQSNGDVIASNAERIISNNWLDYQQTSYFVSLSSHKTGVNIPGNNQTFSMRIGVGERVISRNPNLPIERYDTINVQTTNLEAEANYEFQFMLSSQSAVYGNVSATHRDINQPISNQLFRLGGLRNLRGFNEQFFFTSSFLVNQLEWRIYFEEESFLFAFYDQGLLNNQGWKFPIGLGGGFTLSTNSGLFSFALAVGRTKEIPFEFTNMKVHFGYLSHF